MNMADEKFVTLEAIVNELKLEVRYAPCPLKDVKIHYNQIFRPGLAFAGFYDVFMPDRIQVAGLTEDLYLASLEDEVRHERINTFFDKKPCCVIATHKTEISDYSMDAAVRNGVPLLISDMNTSEFMAALIAYLNVQLAPTITRHGVFVEIYGEGVLIVGDSGVGKSETAIELIKRGHRLIADDAVELKRVSAKTIVGSAPDIIRHYIELRGIGIVDVCRLFGMGSVKMTEKVDLVVELEPWETGKMYERFGMDENYTEIMGNKIPSITIPVKPGRNLAVILEIAAMNSRQKRMGYNTAKEFNDRLLQQMGIDPNEVVQGP